VVVVVAAGAAEEAAAVAEPRGVGIGWRPELDLTIARLGVDFVEVIAENQPVRRPARSLRDLHATGVPVLPHGVGLSLGGADRPDRRRLRHLARLAETWDSPVVSDHVAFVRAGGIEAGHLLPVAFTRDSLDVVAENVRIAQDHLPVPLAVENVSAVMRWPDAEMTEAQFLSELVGRTGVRLVLDVANLHANEHNFGWSAEEALRVLPMEAVSYLHVAGGVVHDGIYHDTHTEAAPERVIELLRAAVDAGAPAAALLEYDDGYPSDAQLARELDQIREVLGAAAR
jgi:uncharacterized protein (UPF0276 family)